VLDRSFVSELVYGPLERGYSRLSFEQAAHLATITAQRGGLLVHLTGHPDQIAARLLARDGHAPTVSRISTLTAARRRVRQARRARTRHHHRQHPVRGVTITAREALTAGNQPHP
jgi:hypothetical protein